MKFVCILSPRYNYRVYDYDTAVHIYHIYVGYICKVQGNRLRLINFQLFNHFPLNPQAIYKSFQTVHHHTSSFGGFFGGGMKPMDNVGHWI